MLVSSSFSLAGGCLGTWRIDVRPCHHEVSIQGRDVKAVELHPETCHTFNCFVPFRCQGEGEVRSKQAGDGHARV